MRVLIVSAVFPPESVVSSYTSAQIAEDLLKRGHQVTVITPFPNRPSGELYPGYSRRLFHKQNQDSGLEVIRCFATLSPKSSMFSRFLENISFGITSGLAMLGISKPDVIYSNNWPIFASGLTALVARLRGVPLVSSIQDIYPEQLVFQGRIESDHWIARCLHSIDKQIAQSSRAIIVISDSMADLLKNTRGVSANRVHVIPNWINSDLLVPDDPSGKRYRLERGIASEDFVVVYAGNIAFAAGVETIVQSFALLKDAQDTHLVVAGEGSNLQACMQIANAIGNPRVQFHTPWPRSENSMVLSAADVLILPTRGKVSLAAMPSKLISYMLAARPIIALALPDSDLARTIERAGCGWVIGPDNPEALAVKIQEVRTLGALERRRIGQCGRDYALANLTREVCVPKVIEILESAAIQDRQCG